MASAGNKYNLLLVYMLCAIFLPIVIGQVTNSLDVTTIALSSIDVTTSQFVTPANSTSSTDSTTNNADSVATTITAAAETSVVSTVSDLTTDGGSGIADNTTVSFPSVTTVFTATTSSEGSGSGNAATVESSGEVATDSATTSSINFTSNPIFSGSGDETTFEPTTTSELGSGAGQGTATAVFIPGSGVGSTTVFEVSTGGGNTTAFIVTTAAAAVINEAFPWYLIVIIILGIIIVILIILFLIYCFCKKSGKSTLEKKATDANEVSSISAPIPTTKPELQTPVEAPAPLTSGIQPAPTILPPPEVEKDEPLNFVSPTPMKAPVFFQDPSASMRKRDRARPDYEQKSSSFDEDEGFIEPIVKKDERTQRRKVKKRKTSVQEAESSPTESEAELIEPKVSYQPYFLPTPIQTALTGRSLAAELTDDAMATRHALQRSDIDRHKNKQRLKMQKARRHSGPHRNDQRRIDAVLEPPPPAVLQGPNERRRLEKHGMLDNRGVPIGQSEKKPKEHKQRHDSSATDEAVNSEEKQRSHEAIISKMAKLLEDAYALLAPAVQKTPVQPFNSKGNTGNVPQPMQPQMSQQAYLPQQQQAMNGQDRFFTRTLTPPALLPQSGVPPYNSTATPGGAVSIPPGASDANSVVWTPYRTYDRLTELQQQDPYLGFSPKTQPSTSKSDNDLLTPRPSTTYSSNYFPQDTFPLPLGVENPFVPTGFSSVAPGSAYPIPQSDVETLRMSQLENSGLGNNNSAAGTNTSTTDLEKNSIETGTDEPAASIVQSIKETLAKLSGSNTPVKNLDESAC